MKKKILLLFISFFAFSINVFAGKQIHNVQMEVVLDAEGNANVIEVWQVNKQTGDSYFEKNFREMNGVTLSDISVTSLAHGDYTKVDKYDGKDVTYEIINKNDKSAIKFKSYEEADTYTLKYKIVGMVNAFKDVQGIDWYFLSRNNYQEINTFNVSITGPIAFSQDNTALYVLSNKDVACQFDNGRITIFASNLTVKTQIRLMTTFTNISFVNTKANSKDFKTAYNDAKNQNELLDELKDYLSKEVIQIALYSVVGVIVLIIITKIFNRAKSYNEFSGIKSEVKEKALKLEDVNYCENVPCNADLYKIAFIAGYHKIIKNRSDLIGAILLKWLYEGKVSIARDHDRPYIKLVDNLYFERKLDYDLYEMLTAASNNNVLDNTRLIRYASQHYLRVMTWFNMGFNESINDEFSRGNIKRIKRVRKTDIVLTKNIHDQAVEIMGVKKYLLNFNQVPRQTELTQEGYKYLLVMAELLGIGTQVAKEILRKNPDNYMAKSLLDMEEAKFIFKSVYQSALNPYKEVMKHNKVNSTYDEELENLLKQRENQEDRKSVL